MRHIQIITGTLFILLLCQIFVPVQAEGGMYSLTMKDAWEKDGFISANLTLSVSGASPVQGGYLTLWLADTDDIKKSRFLTFAYIPFTQSGRPVLLTAAVPRLIQPGSYTIIGLFSPGDRIPITCEPGVQAESPLMVNTPGTGVHDMAATLAGDLTAASGPDYRIAELSGVETIKRVATGKKIEPVISVNNGGSPDTTGRPVEVHAYLGSEELIPVRGTIQPLQAGEAQVVKLLYLIPATTPLQSYPFFLIVDPRSEHGPADAKTNLIRAGGQMSVRIQEDPKPRSLCMCAI
ncbi:MAG TPA: hypothetical protein VN372_13150 [Methanospirillum sp.]|nr:hypothetical protein [Methanospirillum sp.]